MFALNNMKLTGIYLDYRFPKVQPAESRGALILQYQRLCEYLALAATEWIRTLNLDLGPFNRIIFEEDADVDLQLVGEKAFVVRLNVEFPGFDQLCDSRTVHSYFSRKLIEGFDRFDQHFTLGLARQFREFLASAFADGYSYTKTRVTRKRPEQIRVFDRYTFDVYDLVLAMDSPNEPTKEIVLFTGLPDAMLVHFAVRKIVMTSEYIHVTNDLGKTTLLYRFGDTSDWVAVQDAPVYSFK